MNELWNAACEAWDEDLISTEDIKRLAAMLFPVELLPDALQHISYIDLDLV